MSPGHPPLLVTGPARAGTTLVARALGAHPGIELAVDPLLPLVRLTRDALAAAAGIALAPGTPLLDGYFDAGARAVLDAVWHGDLDAPVDPAAVAALGPALAARAAHEAPDLAPALAAISGATASDLWRAAFDAIARVRGVPPGAWVGTKEVWAAELAPALARAFPALRIVLVRRDPRAVAASNLAVGDSAQAAHPLSAARHWRKQEAILAALRADPALAARVTVVGYEELVRAPEPVLAELAAHLGLTPVEDLVGRMRGPDGRPFAANTSHGVVAPGLRPELAERWRGRLEPGVLGVVELVCGAEMRAAGIVPDGAEDGARPEPEVRARLVADDARPWSWRSDRGDPAEDLRQELARRRLMADPSDADEVEVRHHMLFPQALAALRP